MTTHLSIHPSILSMTFSAYFFPTLVLGRPVFHADKAWLRVSCFLINFRNFLHPYSRPRSGMQRAGKDPVYPSSLATVPIICISPQEVAWCTTSVALLRRVKRAHFLGFRYQRHPGSNLEAHVSPADSTETIALTSAGFIPCL